MNIRMRGMTMDGQRRLKRSPLDAAGSSTRGQSGFGKYPSYRVVSHDAGQAQERLGHRPEGNCEVLWVVLDGPPNVYENPAKSVDEGGRSATPEKKRRVSIRAGRYVQPIPEVDVTVRQRNGFPPKRHR